MDEVLAIQQKMRNFMRREFHSSHPVHERLESLIENWWDSELEIKGLYKWACDNSSVN